MVKHIIYRTVHLLVVIRVCNALSQNVILIAFQLQQWLQERASLLRCMYEGWNFNSGNYLFTTDTK